MIPPAYRHSVSSSLMPLDLNEDQNQHLLITSPNHQPSSSFISSLSYPIHLFNPPDQVQDQDQQRSYCWEPNHLPSVDHEETTGKIINISSSGSWDNSAAEIHESSIGVRKLTVWKKEDRGGNLQAAEDINGSVKWMSSKIAAGNSMHKFEEDQKQPLSPDLRTDNSSTNNFSNHSSNNSTVRVCADCHTTKTPLWRSGPTGPKTLCNACGIRQRKARRAAAASANGTILMAGETSMKGNKFRNKEKKSKIECAPHMKKKRKHVAKPSQSRKKFTFEDLTLRLSKNVALKQVFPQEEKEAAILLMALSYGLVHG